MNNPFEQMHGLTLKRPWPWAFEHATDPKSLDNRRKKPWGKLIGRYVALHAGFGWDTARVHLIQELEPTLPLDPELHPTGIFGVARLTGFVTTSTDRWWLGPMAWTFESFHFFEPVPCKGTQGFWVVPTDVVEVMANRLVRASR